MSIQRLAAGALALLLLAPGGAALAAEEGDGAVARARLLEEELVGEVARFRDATVSILTKGGGERAPTQSTTRPLPLSAVGSGVLIRYRGLWVLTNNHVVDSSGRLEVVTSDGRPHAARVRGRNTQLDLALLAFDRTPTGLRPISLEGPAPGRYQEGDWVVASGNPFFLALDGETVASWGILSGVRPPDGDAYIDAPTIQHDAEINPGSSGGPLFSAQGHLLGLNGTIATRSRTQATGPSHTGASFAVPMARIRPFLRGVLGTSAPAVGVRAAARRAVHGHPRPPHADRPGPAWRGARRDRDRTARRASRAGGHPPRRPHHRGHGRRAPRARDERGRRRPGDRRPRSRHDGHGPLRAQRAHLPPVRPPEREVTRVHSLGRAVGGVLLLVLVAVPVRGAGAGAVMAEAEAEYQRATAAMLGAAVTVVPANVQRGEPGFSSGVLVSPAGLILSDGDAGLEWRIVDGERVAVRHDDVNVRVYDRRAETSRLYRARILARDVTVDTSLIRIANAPPGGFPFVTVGRSAGLEAGHLLFAAGTAFDEEGHAPPTATAGVVSSLDPGPAGEGPGGPAWIYTTAAINQGVNGGPVVDLDGRLVGTVSTWEEPTADGAYQFLGKVAPIDRVVRALAHVAPVRDITPVVGDTAAGPAHDLQRAFALAARRMAEAVVSLEVTRRRPVSAIVPTDHEDESLLRYTGPVSGLLVSTDLQVVTSLYNLTNVQELVHPLWRAPAGSDVPAGLEDILSIRAYLPDGRTAAMQLVGYDERLGIALLDVVGRAGASARPALDALPFEPAPREAFQAGRFVITVGNPFGSARRPEPLVTVGILSKLHATTAAAAWRGQWQTDAGGLDSNCGGGAADLDGRLLGLLQIWHPARHGRNSGVAFIVPWPDLERSVERIRQGRGGRRGFLGVSFASGDTPRLAEVVADSAAADAGLQVGDVILRIDESATGSVADVITIVGHRTAGDVLDVAVDRGGTRVVVEVVLGQRARP